MMRVALLIVLLAATEFGSAAGAAAEQLARLPRPRPELPADEVSAWAGALEQRFHEASVEDAASAGDNGPDAATEAIASLAPLPRPRPASPQLVALPLVGPQQLPSIPVPVEADDPDCPERLKTLGVTFTEEPPIAEGECTVARPLKVTALGEGVAIEPDAIMSCRAAESLAHWVKEALLLVSLRFFSEAPTAILHGSTYVCRPRNNVAGAKLSEHAHANAVDLSQIRFADREAISIGASAADSSETKFENEIRAAACDHFTTVLGPGSDAAHALHLHFDLALRRGGYRLCELGAPSVALAPGNTKRE
jgi:hypothetical protein